MTLPGAIDDSVVSNASNDSDRNCAVKALQQTVEALTANDVSTMQALRLFFDRASAEAAGPMRVTDVWHEMIAQCPAAAESFECISDIVGDSAHPLQAFVAAHFPEANSACIPTDSSGLPFKLIEAGHIIHAPDLQNARSGHFVATMSDQHDQQEHRAGPQGGSSIWRMTFYILRPNTEEDGLEHADLCSKVFIHFSSPSSPLGEGGGLDCWDEVDWGLGILDAGVQIGENYHGRKFFKHTQFINQRADQAPKGGMWARTKSSSTTLSTAFSRGGYVLGGLGTAKSIYDGYQEGGLGGALRGGFDGMTGWGCAVLATKLVGLAMGTAALSVPGICIGAGAALISSFASDYFELGSKILDMAGKGWDFAAAMFGSGLSGGGGSGGGPGGVDLRRVPSLKGLHREAALLSKGTLHSFFPLKVDWQVVSNLVNTRILPAGMQIAAENIPTYILHECLRMQHLHDAPLLFSLHFGSQGNSDLYSVMHPALRRTLTGYILGFTDYYLKSYLNGGTYSEEFLRNYAGGMSSEALQSAVIDLRLELKKARNQMGTAAASVLPNEYVTLRDLLDDDASNKESVEKYHSAFRIIGDIAGLDFDDSGVLQPRSTFLVESDLNMLPDRAAEVVSAAMNGSNVNKVHEDIVNAFDKMRVAVKEDMPRMPHFAPYFELLNVVTFCASLARTLADAGVMPPVCSIPPALDIPPFPAVMPPIPIRQIVSVNINASFPDWCAFAVADPSLAGDVGKVDALVAARLLTATITTQQIQEANTSACKIARALIVSRIVNSAAVPTLDTFDETELKATALASNVTRTGVQYLAAIIAMPIIGEVRGLLHVLSKDSDASNWVTRMLALDLLPDQVALVKNDFIPHWTRLFDAHKAQILADIKRQAREADENERKEVEELVAKIRRDGDAVIERERQSLHQRAQAAKASQLAQFNDMIRFKPVNQFYIDKTRRDIENSVDQQTNAFIASMVAEVNGNVSTNQEKVNAMLVANLSERKGRVDALNISETQRMDGLKATCLTDINKVCSDAMTNATRSVAHLVTICADAKRAFPDMCKAVVHKVRLPLLSLPTPADFHMGIVGGCGLGKSSVMVNKTVSVSMFHSAFLHAQSDAQVRGDGSKFFHWALPVEPAIVHGCWMKARYHQERDLSEIRSTVYALQSVSTEMAISDVMSKDSAGNTLAHHAVQFSLQQSLALVKSMTLEQCNVARVDGFRPLDVACSCGNVAMVQILLDKGASATHVLPNGLTPLLIACQANRVATAMTILSTKKFDKVNHTTDTKMTSLHWAVHHNSPALVAELISKGALLIPRRSDSATPLHLAMEHGYKSCAEILLGSLKTNLKDHLTADKRNVLHHAAAGNSCSCISTIPQELMRVLVNETDCSGHTPIDVARLHGYFDFAVMLAKFTAASRYRAEDCAVSPFLALNARLKETAGSFRTDAVPKMAALRHKFDQDSSLSNNQAFRLQSLSDALTLRDVEMFNFLSRRLTLSSAEEVHVLRAVAQEGLVDWISALSEAGIRIHQLFPNGTSVLDIAASKNDL